VKRAYFKRGEKCVYFYNGGEVKKLSLKLNCRDIDELRKLTKEERMEKIKGTNQYKTMTSLGFKTVNGKAYTLDKPDLWVSMSKGVIHKMKVNGWLEEGYTLEVEEDGHNNH